MDLRGPLVGPPGTPLRVGVPVVLASFAAAALSTTLILSGAESGGVYFPFDMALVALVASAGYAARYRAAVVCLVIGAAASAGSYVGFHALHGDETVLGVLVRIAGRADVLGAGLVFGAAGVIAGFVAGYAVRFRRSRA